MFYTSTGIIFKLLNLIYPNGYKIKNPIYFNWIFLHIFVFIMKIGKKLRKIRKKHGYSCENVCEAINICRTTLHLIEIGKADVTYNTLNKLLLFYGYEINIKKNIDVNQLAKRIVDILNPDVIKWDSDMYNEKNKIVELLNDVLSN